MKKMISMYDEYDTELSWQDIDRDLEIFDEFNDIAEYTLCEYRFDTEQFYAIRDEQLNEFRNGKTESDEPVSFTEIVDYWLGKVSTYYLDEFNFIFCLDKKYIDDNEEELNDEGIRYVIDNYFQPLYNIAIKYNLKDNYDYLLKHIKDLESELTK